MANKKEVAEKVTISYSRYLEMYKKAEKYNEIEEKHKEVETKYNKLIERLDYDEMLTDEGEYDTKKLWNYRSLAVWGMDCRAQGCNPYNPYNKCLHTKDDDLKREAEALFNKPFDGTYKDSHQQ